MGHNICKFYGKNPNFKHQCQPHNGANSGDLCGSTSEDNDCVHKILFEYMK